MYIAGHASESASQPAGQSTCQAVRQPVTLSAHCPISPVLPCPAVTITVRNDVQFNQLRDVEVRVGGKLPGNTAATAVDKVNAVCVSRTGQLAAAKGQTVQLKCTPARSGRYITVHIK